VVQGAIAASREALGDDTVVELASLPKEVLDDEVRYCHGSPVSDVRSFLPQPGDDDEELVGEASERRIVFGHTHLPFRREGPAGVELVNPGSVGMPFDRDPRAAYALVRDGGELEHRRVEYDHQGSATAVRERYDGWAETVARRIQQARFDV
jgi:diadenosine tetraphosphatase ApaH/serine/threonine PP2A family protein phosphatase